MLMEFEAYAFLQTQFKAHFIQAEGSPASPLTEEQLSLLEQLLWLTANIVSDCEASQVEAYKYQVDYFLGVILHDYHAQFKEGLWRVLTWTIHTLAMGLPFIKSPIYDTFNIFVHTHFKEIEEVVLKSEAVDKEDKALVRSDIMAIVFKLMEEAPDEQVSFVTRVPHL